MGKMRAAIKASSKARKNGLPHQLRVCWWEGPNGEDCQNEARGLVDADGWNCCAEHGGIDPAKNTRSK